MVDRVNELPSAQVSQADYLRRARKSLSNLTAPEMGAPHRAQAVPTANVFFAGPFMQVEFTVLYNLPADERRTYLFILNTGAATLYADFTNGPGPNVRGIQIAAPLGFYEPIRAPTTGCTLSGTGVIITSSTKPEG